MVAMKDIRAFARRIGEEFRPVRVILFGSYAYGTPTEDSDVDLMVVFSGRRSAIDRSLGIRLKLPSPGFPLDLLARSEGEMNDRIRMNDSFMKEIAENGKVIYEARDRMGGKSGRGLQPRAARTARAKDAGS